MKEILITCKGQFEHTVPIISISQTFNSLGIKVSVVCSSYELTAKKNFFLWGLKLLNEYPLALRFLKLPDNNLRKLVLPKKLRGYVFHHYTL